MRGREGKVPPAADLLVCFPSRAHLSMIPKPICSPVRPPESAAGQQRRHRLRRKSNSRLGVGVGNGHGSPQMWMKSKAPNSDLSEPTSPKVTCAGQIKVRAKPSSCKNWQSVMEEIERMHKNRKQKRRSTWIESLGFKKDVMQFLTCLRNLRFDFRCFGAFPSAGITSDDDEDDDDEDEDGDENHRLKKDTDGSSNAVFSKWYMILQENQGTEFANKQANKGKTVTPDLADDENDGEFSQSAAPPPNALMLMRCRSAPAKNWLLEENYCENQNATAEEQLQPESVTAQCGGDCSKISDEIARETWIVGGIRDMLPRSRSWKR
ncbi:uncharacterized protein LOC127242664 [Andrographis paniculata]|uniref:uncharacterized protein LOC127242664 n=1 Tax=Andrographis paniculata TaxID=175694 RepID=UPI0021E77D8E|nr:uncharacterized protein LOC127242664 [Andrographis paniculata]